MYNIHKHGMLVTEHFWVHIEKRGSEYNSCTELVSIPTLWLARLATSSMVEIKKIKYMKITWFDTVIKKHKASYCWQGNIFNYFWDWLKIWQVPDQNRDNLGAVWVHFFLVLIQQSKFLQYPLCCEQKSEFAFLYKLMLCNFKKIQCS